MSHEHEAVYLAVASLDFELSPDERRRMGAGLAACRRVCGDRRRPHRPGSTARSAAGARRLAPGASAGHAGGPRAARATNRWPVLLAAAALLGLTIAAAAAAGAFRERSPLDGSVVGPSASPPALGDLESPLPSSSAGPVSSQDLSGPGFGAAARAGHHRRGRVGPARIRSAPRVADNSVKHEPLLDIGDRLLVFDGPVVASDYEWYQVMAWRPGNLYKSWPVGWVSRGDHDGSPWIQPSADPCPAGAVTMDIVEDLHPQERVACFGDRPLRLRAYVSGERGERAVRPGSRHRMHRWSRLVDRVTADGPRTTDTALDTPSIGGPSARHRPRRSGAVVGAAGRCHGRSRRRLRSPSRERMPARCHGPDAQPIDAAAARLECRARFVVTAVRSDPDYPLSNSAAITVLGQPACPLRTRTSTASATNCFRMALVSGSSMGRSSRPTTNGSRSSPRPSTPGTAPPNRLGGGLRPRRGALARAGHR